MTQALISGNVICAFISAKWAMELVFSEGRQILFLFGGLLIGPLMLLILYIRLQYKYKEETKVQKEAS
jgi:hypothetical protein